MADEKEDKASFMKGKHWLIVIIILVAAYGIYTGIGDLMKSKRLREKWTTEERTLFIDQCMNEAGPKSRTYPELTREYCACSTDSIMTTFTKNEYMEITQKPTEEQMKVLLPLFEDCLTEYKNAIENADSLFFAAENNTP